MRLKYFLRGLGIGIIITSLILTISHSASRKMSDNEVIERASKLGMTFDKQEESESENASDTTTETEQTEPTSTQDETTSQDESASKDENTSQDETTEPVTTTQEDTAWESVAPTETSSEPVTEQETATKADVTEQPESTEQPGDVITYTLIVVRGMSSNAVCRNLYENGIIGNAADFDNYLVNNGYAEKIRVGSFEVRSDMSYDELIGVFCSK